ncbi:MAG: tRNA-binding protein [Halobacteria archaeon]|nr:tRNA-binding protein [Halobacteria archaeon]
MWETSDDYRLLVARESVDLFERTLEGAKFQGSWDKSRAREIADETLPIIEELRYSYLEPDELAESPQVEKLEDKADEVVEALGGDEWYREFREKADDRRKVERSIADVRFFLNTLRNLDRRFALGEIDDPIVGVDVVVGEVMSVSEHPETDELLVCNVGIGERALAVVTNDLDVSENDAVAVAVLPPSDFHGITSEGMFLGNDDGVLTNVEGETGELPDDVPLDAFDEARNLVDAFLSD